MEWILKQLLKSILSTKIIHYITHWNIYALKIKKSQLVPWPFHGFNDMKVKYFPSPQAYLFPYENLLHSFTQNSRYKALERA